MNRLRLLLMFFSILLVVSSVVAQNYSGVSTCQGCHSNAGQGRIQYTEWSATRHAVAYDSIAIVQNQQACASCHLVGWDTTITNRGSDEYVTRNGDGTFTVSNATEFNRRKNVQCESCHGPVQIGTTAPANHPASGPTPGSLIRATAEQCGTCHEGEHHPYYSEWQIAKHAVSDTNASPFLQNLFRTNPNCSGCHTYQGFLQFVSDTALEPNVAPPGDSSLPIVCVTCHDPHSAANSAQLRIAPASLCQKCHNPEYNPDTPTPTGEDLHHSTAYMLQGKGGYEFAGYTYEQSFHNDAAIDKCVTCHVVRTPFVTGTPASTGHTFLPKAVKCAECHGDFDTLATNFNYRNVQTEIDSLLGVLGGNLASASSADSTTFAFKAAKFNYDFVESDGSRGIHNTAYARGLLLSAIINFTPTGVILVDPTVPEKYSLQQNFPNPFNPTTKIVVDLPARGSARLNIYSINGELVATLMNGAYDAGRYEVTWNGLNGSGTQVANGVYIYRLESGNFMQTKKMMLMK